MWKALFTYLCGNPTLQASQSLSPICVISPLYRPPNAPHPREVVIIIWQENPCFIGLPKPPPNGSSNNNMARETPLYRPHKAPHPTEVAIILWFYTLKLGLVIFEEQLRNQYLIDRQKSLKDLNVTSSHTPQKTPKYYSNLQPHELL